MRTRFVFKVCLNKIKEKQLCGEVMVLSLRLFGVLRVPPSHAVQIHRREGCRTETEEASACRTTSKINVEQIVRNDQKDVSKQSDVLQPSLDGITFSLFSPFIILFLIFHFFCFHILIICTLSLLYFFLAISSFCVSFGFSSLSFLASHNRYFLFSILYNNYYRISLSFFFLTVTATNA